MACSLAFPCGGAARLVVVLPDAALYECINGHTLRVGAPAPRYAPTLASHPTWGGARVRKRKKPTYCGRRNCRSFPTRGSVFCSQHKR